MLHNFIDSSTSGEHYAVAPDSFFGKVLVQLQERGEQARIPLTPEQARHFAGLLTAAADMAERGI